MTDLPRPLSVDMPQPPGRMAPSTAAALQDMVVMGVDIDTAAKRAGVRGSDIRRALSYASVKEYQAALQIWMVEHTEADLPLLRARALRRIEIRAMTAKSEAVRQRADEFLTRATSPTSGLQIQINNVGGFANPENTPPPGYAYRKPGAADSMSGAPSTQPIEDAEEISDVDSPDVSQQSHNPTFGDRIEDGSA